ncbi:30S ribosomal protein S17 [Candidatus Parcubacteria bacterium]|nr:MAG: 30S ribosomal protein S17 [Candidatus Parcubacteria bacterium]
MNKEEKKTIKRKLHGVVISDKMKNTLVVRVERTKTHPKYIKLFKIHKNYHVDDSLSRFKAGDKVSFEECRPLSKNKRWRVIYGKDVKK